MNSRDAETEAHREALSGTKPPKDAVVLLGPRGRVRMTQPRERRATFQNKGANPEV